MNINGFYKDKRVLITGHTGFKGSWLTEWLLMLGAKVTGVALPPATEPALFDQLGLAGRCDHRIGDIRDRALVRRVIHEIRPDVIFHLAAQPLVRLSYAQPLETYETNVMGTAHVLDALRDSDWPCAAVMITTDKVYENKEWLHAYRESDPLGGYDPYSSSKACAELVIQSYRNSFFNPSHISRLTSHSSRLTSHVSPPLVAVASARAGNVIGGGDWAQDRIVPDCMRALSQGEVIVVRNPAATRPWQHVLEPLSGYLLLGMRMHNALVNPESENRGPKSEARGPKSEVRSPCPEGRNYRITDYGTRTPDLGLWNSDYGTRVSDLGHRISVLSLLSSSFNFGPSLASNRAVRELVEETLKLWPGKWEDRSDPGALHEAGKLNLAADKAFHLLGWEGHWNFKQTLEATVLWYKTVHEKGAGMARSLVERQIKAYEDDVHPS